MKFLEESKQYQIKGKIFINKNLKKKLEKKEENFNLVLSYSPITNQDMIYKKN